MIICFAGELLLISKVGLIIRLITVSLSLAVCWWKMVQLDKFSYK